MVRAFILDVGGPTSGIADGTAFGGNVFAESRRLSVRVNHKDKGKTLEHRKAQDMASSQESKGYTLAVLGSGMLECFFLCFISTV